MLGFLFRTLTAEPRRGTALFGALTASAREPHWYVEGKVPDTIDGRFAVLATLIALTLVRLEKEDEAGNVASVALTERFIAVMESEHRELGLGDPTLGKTVRKLVGSLGRRTELWRSASGKGDWNEAARASLYKAAVPAEALRYSAERLRELQAKLERCSIEQLDQGTIR